MKKASPRNEAGSVKLEGGTGSLIRMIGLDGFMEAYKSDTTFRIQTPEDVDPQDTNPAAPWVVTRIDGIGASSPAVARVLLEGRDMLDAGVFSEGLDKDIVTQQLHACKEQLVICEQVSKRLSDAIRVILKQIESEGIGRDNRGRALNPFPKVANLKPETTTFLIHMKRALGEATALVGKVLALDVSGSNFECLSKSLSKDLGSKVPLVEYVNQQVQTVKYLVNLRNYQEHPKPHQKTVIEDFKVMPNGEIRPPVIYLNDEEPVLLQNQLPEIAEYLVKVTEALFIHSVCLKLNKDLPYFIQKIPEEEVKATCPIKYRLSIDLERLLAKSKKH